MNDTLSPETIENHVARLSQYAFIAAEFYKALIAQQYPAEKACELVAVWLESEMTFE